MEKLLGYFVPEKYILDVTINKHKKTIGGRVTVVGEAKNRTVKFHAVRLEIIVVTVNGKKCDFECRDDVLAINGVKLGKVEIEIEYSGKLNENMQGAYLSKYEYGGAEEIIVATQFESHYAREAFPCIDEPAAKAVFELALTVDDTDDIVVSNMPAKSVVKNTTFFEPTPRMSTYLLAFVAGKFHGKTVKNEHGVEIATYAALNQDVDSVDFANEIAARSLEFYDDNFGVRYPLPKLTQVALPDFEAGAMENWGLVTYRESMLLASPKATLGTKKGVALTVAHELSHQWFGNLVTMKWWNDLWLNESFANVMEYYAVDAICSEYKIWQSFFTGDAYAALMRDAASGVQSVHQDVKDPAEIATLFDPAIVYAKGARLMLMLIRMMGWENFCKGIQDYFNKYAYQNTVGDNLWQALTPYAGFNVGELMHAFIDRPGYPVVTGDKQKRFLLDGEMPESDWPLPKITEDMSGHYILNLSDAEFQEKLDKFESLNLEEKLRLLIDRNLLAKTKLVSSASLVPLVEKFKHEDAAAVWNILTAIVGGLKIFFVPDSAAEKTYKKFVRELVHDKLMSVGIAAGADDDENTLRLRANLMVLAFYAEDKSVIDALAEMYDDDYTKLNAETREDILNAKLYKDPTVINDYLEAYEKTADPELKFELLFSGTISKDEKVLGKMLALLGDVDKVKPQDQLYLFVYLYRNHRSREQAFLWLVDNWASVREMMGDKSLDSYPRYIANVARTEKELDEYAKFFEPMRDDPAMKRAIEIGEKEIKARLELIRDDAEAVERAVREKVR